MQGRSQALPEACCTAFSLTLHRFACVCLQHTPTFVLLACVPGGSLPYHYQWENTHDIIAKGIHVVDMNGQTPCCIDNVTIPGLVYAASETVASNNRQKSYVAGEQIQVGSVLGTCNFRQQTASITWKGTQYAMPFAQGRALYVVGEGEFQSIVGSSHHCNSLNNCLMLSG